MAKNEKLSAAKISLKEVVKTHKENTKALAAAQKAFDKSTGWVEKAQERVDKHTPAAE